MLPMTIQEEYQLWRTAQMGHRQIERDDSGEIVHRVPTSIVQLIGANSVGWFGWEPLNDRWVSATYGLPYAYAKNLRAALEWINWFDHPTSAFTINWLQAYPHASSFGVLTVEQRRRIAEIIESGRPLVRPVAP